jgi:hypothetical protein
MIIEVRTASELQRALEDARGGETILLAAGDYGNLELQGRDAGQFQYQSTVTIRSAVTDPAEHAVFSGLTLNRVVNLDIEHVTFDYDAAPGAPGNEKFTQVLRSQDVAIRNVIFDGDLAEELDAVSDGYATGIGLHVDQSRGIEIVDSTFSEFHRAATFWRTDDLKITGNDVHSMRSDGFNFADVDNVLIEGNHIHSFIASFDSEDHRDFIQFWTAATDSPSVNVIIRGNLLDVGDGDWTQSIFINNEQVEFGLAGEEMFYQDFLIEDNVIRNAQLHGITVREIDGLTIRNNTVMYSQSDNTSTTIPSIRVVEDAKNVTITGNIAHDITAPDGALVLGNLLVDVRDYETLSQIFANPLDPDVPAREALQTHRGPEGQADVGAAMLYLAEAGEKVAMIDYERGEGISLSVLSLAVSDLADDLGGLGLGDIESVSWDMGEGTTLTGLEVEHVYTLPGDYQVTAIVGLQSGEILTLERTIRVDTAIAYLGKYGEPAAGVAPLSSQVGAQQALVDHAAEGVDLNGEVLRIGADASFLGNARYTVSVDFKLDASDESGARLINYTGSFHLQYNNDDITVALITDKGTEWLTIRDVGIDLDTWHRITMSFCNEEGSARVFFDNEEVGQISGYEGAIQVGNASQDLIVGDPFKGFSGQVNNVLFLTDQVGPDVVDTILDSGGIGAVLVDAPVPEAPVETGPIVLVSTAEELKAALSDAEGGETILMEGGDYGRVVLRNLAEFSEDVTVRSLDAGNRAEIDFLYLDGVNNLLFDTLVLGGNPGQKTPVQVIDSVGITFDSVLFDGAAKDNGAIGMTLKDSAGISLRDSTFSGFDRALVARNSTDLELESNLFSKTTRDVLTFVDSSGIVVSRNTFNEVAEDRFQTLIRFDNANGAEAFEDVIVFSNLFDIDEHDTIDVIRFNNDEGAPSDTVWVLDNLMVSDASGRLQPYGEATPMARAEATGVPEIPVGDGPGLSAQASADAFVFVDQEPPVTDIVLAEQSAPQEVPDDAPAWEVDPVLSVDNGLLLLEQGTFENVL